MESNPGSGARADAVDGEVPTEVAVGEPALWMVVVCSQTGYIGSAPLKSKGQVILMAREIRTFCLNLSQCRGW